MYVKLFTTLLDSTLWGAPEHVFKTFLAMLLLSDFDGNVEVPIPALARRVGITIAEAEEALAHLEAPDAYSRTPDDDGRRIRRAGDRPLWHIVNYAKYRGLKNAEERRQQKRVWAQKHRDAQLDASQPTPEETTDLTVGVDTRRPTSTDVDTRRPTSTQEDVDGDGTKRERSRDSKEHNSSPLAPVASLPALADSCGEVGDSHPHFSQKQNHEDVPAGTSSAKTRTSAKKTSSPILGEDDPAMLLADHIIGALVEREPHFIRPDRKKWGHECTKLIAKANSSGMSVDVLKLVIADAILHDGAGPKKTRYYVSPSSFLGEWKNGADKLNAAIINWRSRQSSTTASHTSTTKNRRDYDVSARTKQWGKVASTDAAKQELHS